MRIKPELIAWSQRYQAALRKYLEQRPGASLRQAHGLGREAVALGLQTLDLARYHEQALRTLASPGGASRAGPKSIDRAKVFFAETIVPIEKTHRAALNADARVSQLAQSLRRRTAESSASTRRLDRGIAQRRAAEAAFKTSGRRRLALLQESRRLQNRLRHQTRAILSAQEDERQKTSRHLHDEIAQTLLALNLRLWTLKASATANTKRLEKEIAETQRLVKQSVYAIKQWSRR